MGSYRPALIIKANSEMILGDLEESDDGDCYEGFSEDGFWCVRVPLDVLAEAHHILTMRGISRTRHNAILYDVAIWIHDATFHGLEGVEVFNVKNEM
jgi:hypothetical protein